MTDLNPADYVTATSLAAELGMGMDALYSHVRRSKLTAVKESGRWLVHKDEAAKFRALYPLIARPRRAAKPSLAPAFLAPKETP